jgi:cathepsin L
VSAKALPVSVDWREKGIITSVKDQGECGSCWAFATADLTESYLAMSTGRLNDLSIQQITDCTPNPQHCGGTGGCGGATAELGWAQITKMGGLSSEWTYPYTSYFGTNHMCNQNQIEVVARVTKFVNLPVNEQAPVLNYIASYGPLAISVDASSWAHYETGVYNGCNQTNPDLDHAVMLVGYGTDSQYGDYWIVRNSWSPQWGEQGYIRLHRQNPVTCGTDLNPSDGDGCTGGPPTVTVCGTCGILFDTLYPVVG